MIYTITCLLFNLLILCIILFLIVSIIVSIINNNTIGTFRTFDTFEDTVPIECSCPSDKGVDVVLYNIPPTLNLQKLPIQVSNLITPPTITAPLIIPTIKPTINPILLTPTPSITTTPKSLMVCKIKTP